MEPCLEATRSLFASPRSLTISNPLLRNDRLASEESKKALQRRSLVISQIARQLRGQPARFITNEQLIEYLYRAIFTDNVAVITALWREAARGRLSQASRDQLGGLDEISAHERLNANRLIALADTVQAVSPIYWLVDTEFEFQRKASSSVQVRKALDVLTNLKRHIGTAILEESLTAGVALTPLLTENHRRMVGQFLAAREKVRKAKKTREEVDKPSEPDAIRFAARMAVEDAESDLLRIRKTIIEFEALIATDQDLVKRVISQELLSATTTRLLKKSPELEGEERGQTALRRALVEVKLTASLIEKLGNERDATVYFGKGGGKRRDAYLDLLSGSAFEWQYTRADDVRGTKFSDAVGELYQHAICVKKQEDNREGLADWITTSIDKYEPLKKYCAILTTREEAEKLRVVRQEPRPFAFFAGLDVLPPQFEADLYLAPSPEQALLRRHFEALGLTLVMAEKRAVISASGKLERIE